MTSADNAKILPTTLFAFIWRYLKNKKLFLFGFFITALIWSIDLSLSPYLLKVIIDAVVQHSQDHIKLMSAILFPAILYVSMSLILNLTFRLYDYINLRLFPEIKAAVTKDMYAYLLHHSHTFFQNHFSGSLARKIFDMGTHIDQIISIFNEWFYPRFIAMIIASMTLFIAVQPIFGIILFVWAFLFVILSYIAAKSSENLARINSEAAAKMSGSLSDSITNTMSIKLFANIPSESALLDKDIDQVVATDRSLQWRNLTFNFLQGLSVTALTGSMLAALIYGNLHGWVSPGDFALVLMLSFSFVWSVFDIGQQMLKFAKVVGICNQSLSFIRIPHEIIDAPDAIPLKVNQGEITFRNVFFQYPNNKPLFSKLNITIHSGEKVGLVGYSGGGKIYFY